MGRVSVAGTTKPLALSEGWGVAKRKRSERKQNLALECYLESVNPISGEGV